MVMLADQIGNKSAGQLIRSEDWNALVAALDTLRSDFETQMAAIDARVSDLEIFRTSAEEQLGALTADVSSLNTMVLQLQNDFNSLRDAVEPLFQEYYRVTMETTKVNYAIGELAEIVARVTDLQGNPLDLSNATTRPWVDFVTAWGQLKTVGSSQALQGAGNRTISVQVNAQGEARVRLQSEHAENFDTADEEEVAASLTTVLQNNMSIADTILQASTPMDNSVKQAYRTISAEYDRSDAISVRNYVDTYYLKYGSQITDARISSTFRHRWRDYRTTVMAFVKADSDPRTPDQSRGVSSIQVTFRDWIGPWIVLDYIVETAPFIQDFRDRLIPKITEDLTESLTNFKEEVLDFTRNKGLVGKQREYQVMRTALDQVSVTQPPAFMNVLTKATQDAISIQQTIETAQAASIGAPRQEVAFEVFTDAALRGDVNVAMAQSGISSLQQQLSEFQQSFNQIGQQVSSLSTSVQVLDERTTNIQNQGSNLSVDIATVRDQVRAFEQINASEIQDGIGKVNVLWADRLNTG